MKTEFLAQYDIPPAVAGGLICSAIVAIVYKSADVQINNDTHLKAAPAENP